jgi:hypothetical protein
MITPHRQYTQFELFPSSSRAQETTSRPRLFIERISFKLENLVVLFMVIIMIMVLSFSWGVERGKKIVARKNINPPMVAATAEIGPGHDIITPESLAVSSPQVLSQPVEVKSEQDPVVSPDNAVAISTEIASSEKSVDNVYTVQVASFKKGSTYAEKEAINLKDKGYEILVIPKGKYSIVCVGKFALEDQANVFSQKLKKQYKDCLVRRL